MLAIVGAVLLANVPLVLGFLEANPLGSRSDLVAAQLPGVLSGASTLDINDGVISQAFGHRAALDLLHLQLPWWNPFAGTGAALAGEMQSAALFPPTLLTVFGNGQLYEHMLLEALAGIATYLLLRRLGLGLWASLAPALAFALNGTFAWFGHATVNPVAMLPLLLLGIELGYARSVRGRPGGWWLIAVAGAGSVYAGFPEVAYLNTLLAVVWAVWRAAGARGRARRAFAGKAAAGALGGVLLSAPLLVATLGVVAHSDLELHSTSFLATNHLSVEAAPQLVLPYVFGPLIAFANPAWGNIGGYLGASLATLAVLGLASPGRRGLRLALSAWLLLACARAYGQPPILRGVLGLVPGMSSVDFPRYVFPALELPVAVLAGLGIESLRHAPRRRRLIASGVGLGVVTAAALGSLPLAGRLGPTFDHSAYLPASLAAGALATIAIGVAIVSLAGRWRFAALTAVVALESLVLFVVPELATPRRVRVDAQPVTYLQRHLGYGRFLTLGPLGPNYGSYFGISSINLSDGVLPKPYARYVRALLNPVVAPTLFVGTAGAARILFAPTTPSDLSRSVSGYRAAAVRYVLVPRGAAYALPRGPFTLVMRTATTSIYHVSGAASYFSAPGCRLMIEGRNALTADCAAPAMIVRRETDFPGWSATVDGRSQSIYRVDRLFQGVPVPAGTHRISYEYGPPGMAGGAVALAIGFGWILLPGLISLRARRIAQRASRPSAGTASE